jgi:hypothetical protein
VIEVVISPDRIPAGQPANLSISLKNVSSGACTKLIFALRLPASIMRLHGKDRIEAPVLASGDSVCGTLRVLSERPGKYKISSPNFSYRDHRGVFQRIPAFAADITVGPAQRPEPDPEISLSLRLQDLPLEKWTMIGSLISNTGDTAISNLHVSLSGRVIVEKSDNKFLVAHLAPGQSVDTSFRVFAKEAGPHVPVRLEVRYESSNGRHDRSADYSMNVSSDTSFSSASNMTKILLVAANSHDDTWLQIDREIREIQQAIRLGNERDRIRVEIRTAARVDDISDAVLNTKPTFVHFSGHGGGEEGSYVAEDEFGRPHLIPADGLVELFGAVDPVQCIVVNACSTERLARKLLSVVPNVVGMRQPVGDWAAIAFSIGFYQAVGAGRSIEQAFRLGVAQMKMRQRDATPPVLLFR